MVAGSLAKRVIGLYFSSKCHWQARRGSKAAGAYQYNDWVCSCLVRCTRQMYIVVRGYLVRAFLFVILCRLQVP